MVQIPKNQFTLIQRALDESLILIESNKIINIFTQIFRMKNTKRIGDFHSCNLYQNDNGKIRIIKDKISDPIQQT